MKASCAKRWAVLCRTDNRLDGRREYLLGDFHGLPMLFSTRSACRQYMSEKYGYMRARPDLRAEPHGWKMPIAVKVNVTVARAP